MITAVPVNFDAGPLLNVFLSVGFWFLVSSLMILGILFRRIVVHPFVGIFFLVVFVISLIVVIHIVTVPTGVPVWDQLWSPLLDFGGATPTTPTTPGMPTN